LLTLTPAQVGPDDGNQHPLCLEAKYLKSYFKMMVISSSRALMLSISEFFKLKKKKLEGVFYTMVFQFFNATVSISRTFKTSKLRVNQVTVAKLNQVTGPVP
jgi:hypothetical protein